MNAKMRSVFLSVAGFVAAAGLVLATPGAAQARSGGHHSSGHHSSRHYSSHHSSWGHSRSSVSFSFGIGTTFGSCAPLYYRPSCSYRVGGYGYGYAGCGPVYVSRPVYVNGCAPYPYYYNAYPRTSLTYVYVNPPARVQTTVNDSAYHAWQGSVGAPPVYQTVPHVIVDEQEPEADQPAQDFQEVAPDSSAPRQEAPPAPSAKNAGKPQATSPVEIVNPWELVGKGDYASARDAFAAISEARKAEGRPRIGYAIASAALGDEAAAAAAFRMALIVQPEAFYLPPKSDEIMPVLARTCHTLGNLRDRNATSNNRWMVMAACEYLRGNYPKAREAIKLAREYGESSLGAKNLWRLLGLSNKPLEKVKLGD